ncbi:MAG: hypothetical protein JWM43_2562 [Acidobacteriaceae bacterium]|jgi:hypothetical protein|nr:hypothetical protein [Acidobacteriaceae bacterium]
MRGLLVLRMLIINCDGGQTTPKEYDMKITKIGL